MKSMVTLRRVTRLAYGEALATESREDGAFPVMSSGGFTGSHRCPNTVAPVVVIGRKGSYGAVHWSQSAAFVIDTAYFVDRSQTRHDPRWLYYVLAQADLNGQSEDVGVPGLRRQAAYEVMVPTPPPLEKQRRIADFLDDQVARIDAALTLREEQAEALIERNQSRITSALLGGSVQLLASAPWVTSTASSWRYVPLRAGWLVIDCKHRTPTYVDDGYPVISPGDISPGRLDLRRAHRFVGQEDYLDLADPVRRCVRGDLVYSRNASAGTAAFVDSAEPFTMGQDVCRITSAVNNGLYLMYVLNYLVGPQLDAARVGSTFTRINVDQIKSLRVPIPSPAVQAQVAAQCDLLYQEASLAESLIDRSVRLLQERKRALITAAVTGEFDASTAGTRAASAVTT